MKRNVRKHPLHRSLDYRRVEFDKSRPDDERTFGSRPEGAEYPSLEVAFAEEWEKENRRQPGINQGGGVLQNLMFAQRKDGLGQVCRFIIPRRDAAIAATAIQWLGTNCGSAFLATVLKKAGYRLLAPFEREYEKRLEQQEQWLRERERKVGEAEAGWTEMMTSVCRDGLADTELQRLRAMERSAKAIADRLEALMRRVPKKAVA